MNAIEGWWNVLPQRVSLTGPAELENRGAFLKRLRHIFNWLNKTARAQGKLLCNNQKQRATAVKKLKGARRKW